MDFGSISMRPSNRRWAVSAIAGGGAEEISGIFIVVTPPSCARGKLISTVHITQTRSHWLNDEHRDRPQRYADR